MAPRFHRLPIADVRRETPDAVSIAFQVPEELRADFTFKSGQYLTLRTMFGGDEVRRSYSICSGLDDGELRIAVKRLDGGLFSCFANEALAPGDTLDVMTPMGRFGVTPEPDAARIYVAFAAGSGITPILSIVKTVLRREPQSRFTLFYGNRSSSSIIFKEGIEDLKDRFVGRFAVHHVLSREVQDVPLLNGRLGAEKVEALMRTAGPVQQVDHVFLCGPVGMIEEVTFALNELGLQRERIQAEVFTPTEGSALRTISRPAAEIAGGAQATVTLDGSTHRFAVRGDETLLDAALRNGLDLPYSCRGGMCCTCRARLTKGSATMDENYSLEAWEIEAGFVLTCQSRPTTPAIAVDFDAV
jgi:ring-1,2-phenylacetyl-CoA epoxidase subunit PaaE